MISDRFTFGENWQRYIENHLTDERIAAARDSLTEFYGLSSFEGKTFLDVGCGTGLYSYSAYQLGAEEIVSFDVDSNSVECTEHMKEMAGDPDNWTVMQGNVLEADFLAELDSYDLVYAWGVLHHTGNMYDAIRNTLQLVNRDGSLYIALYNDGTKGGISASTWRDIKRLYNKLPSPGKRLLEAWYVTGFILYYLSRGQNPIAKIRNYHEIWRGMAFYPDVKDWLGGLPYEFASVEEIEQFVTETDESFELSKVSPPEAGTGNNEYLFERK